jgi:acetyltransferase-like isoleucine patch superfamily enzyme
MSMRGSNSKAARARRYFALRRLASSCGVLVDIRAQCFLFRPDQMSLGSRISIHPFCYIDATGGLSIGDDVSIAHGVSILTTEHDFTRMDVPIRDQDIARARVEIGSDVWIGAGARILAGVHIGDHAIVAAGAIVTKDIAPGTIVAGVPARPIRQRS